MACFFTMYLFMRWARAGHRETWQKLAMFVVFTSGYLLIGYSRFLLGVHSANQIVYGWLLGAWTCVLCVGVLNPKLRHFLDRARI